MGNRLSKIYTRTGDDGSTGLGDGARVAKESLRVEAYGSVDETNSAVGVVLAVPTLPAGRAPLPDRGAARSVRSRRGAVHPRTSHDHRRPTWTGWKSNSTGSTIRLPPLKEFILPGGGAGRRRLPCGARRLPPRRAALLVARARRGSGA